MPDQSPAIKPIQIGTRLIGPGHPVYIVAELSANHRQNFDEAVRLVHAAKESGADAVKLQTYTPDTMTIDCDGDNFRHGGGSLWEGQTLYGLYQKGSMPWQWQPELKKVANRLGLDLFSSAYDGTSVDFMRRMGVPAIKISSFELVDLPLIRYAAATGIPLIISTGMAELTEIHQAVDAARQAGATRIMLLKCTSAYPTPLDQVNLRTIGHLAQTFKVPCGLSNHSRDHVIPIAAAALGACMIETHLTLSRSDGSLDSGFSQEPEELKMMVEEVRAAEKSLGTVHFGPTHAEHESQSFRRSLYAVVDIQKDEVVTRENIRSIRPGGGMPPDHLEKLIGRRVTKTVNQGTPITMDLFDANG
jgi:N-acetylneuraminate synthase